MGFPVTLRYSNVFLKRLCRGVKSYPDQAYFAKPNIEPSPEANAFGMTQFVCHAHNRPEEKGIMVIKKIMMVMVMVLLQI